MADLPIYEGLGILIGTALATLAGKWGYNKMGGTKKVKQLVGVMSPTERHSMMSKEAKCEIDKLWEDKQNKDMCTVLHKHICDEIVGVKKAQETIQKDMDSTQRILLKIAGKLNVDL